jgi:ribose transport system substrate-binding protein
MKYLKRLAIAAAAVALMVGGTASAQTKPKLAFVVNGPSDFWKLAEAGVRKAQKELPNHELLFKYPERGDAAIQQRLLEDLMAAGVAAVAVSVLDPKTQIDMLNKIGSSVPLLTFDSDAPSSKRLAYIGSSNTDLGRNAGEIAAKAMPKGGKCMGFVGNTGSDNARERIEGSIAIAADHLGAREFLVGQRFTVADAHLTWALLLLGRAGVDVAQWPSLVDYLARMQARPQVKAAIETEMQVWKATRA